MTTYAIVNDFLNGRDDTMPGRPVWATISASAILQGGNPYFVPDFASRFEARAALAARIGKLGKGISPRFAHRYVDSIAPAAVFVATDMLERLRASALPWTPAISYDRSLALGRFTKTDFNDIAGCRCSITLTGADGKAEVICNASLSIKDLEDTIAAISSDNTLKTGDILLLGLSGTGPEARPDQRATLMINGEESLGFNVR